MDSTGRRDSLRTSSRPPRPALAPPRAALATAVVALLLVAAFGAYLRFVAVGAPAIDVWWHSVVSVERGSAPYAIAVFLAQVGDGVGAAACTAIIAALCFSLRRPRDAAAVMTAAIIGVAASETFKALVLRSRPTGQLFESHGASYPSGHSMGAAAIAVSVALVAIGSERIGSQLTKLIVAAAVVWVLAMMWSRTALHVHWLTDTLAGALLGFAAAILARRLWFSQAAALAAGSSPAVTR
ncbi:phosphatase PAP2 family protein [Leucobacter sp. NPDC058333]|uniref:phosphatase PAP2 family protein n=1 Tax=Leucobacter sp. NPDC058333 TaxID=3346450 RepID=UPI00365106B6